MNADSLLPKDGWIKYIPNALDPKSAEHCFEELLQLISWASDEVRMYGKVIQTRRKFAWYGNEPFAYRYSKTTRVALYWEPVLLTIKTQVEELAQESFNSCLLNLYHNGSEGMGWHSDDEKEMQENGMIASLSLGAGRIFRFKHKREPLQTELLLENGSLLLMGGETQKFWKHQLPVSRKVTGARINLTFRNFVGRTGK